MLIRIAFWGRIRRGLRGMKSVRGAIIGIFGAVVVVLWFFPAAVYIAMGESVDPIYLREIFPMIMLMFALFSLLSSAENSIYFSPAEINFLFPAPFTRRQLLVYRVLTIGIASALTAIIFTIIMGRFAPHIIAAYIGITMAFFFLSLFGMAVQLVGESIALRSYSTGRKAIAVLALIGVAVVLYPALQSDSVFEGWRDARQHPLMTAMLFPLEPFGRLVSAENYFPDLFLWMGVCLAMCGGLFTLIVALDVNYNEASIRVSQDVYNRIQRMRAGGVFQSRGAKAGFSIPAFPAMGGFGITAWRQLTQATRVSKTMLFIMAMMIFCVGIPLVFIPTDGEDFESGQISWMMIVGGILWITFFFGNALRFDFRNDVDQMDVLKSLPVHPVVLVGGQLFTPIFLTTLFQSVIAIAGAVFYGPWYYAPMVIAFMIPVNALLYAMENLSFLIYPTRAAATSPGDIQFLGRQMLMMAMKAFALGVAICLAICVALFALFFGLSWWIVGAIIWLIVAAEAIAMVPLIVIAFHRFDPSLHTPA